MFENATNSYKLCKSITLTSERKTLVTYGSNQAILYLKWTSAFDIWKSFARNTWNERSQAHFIPHLAIEKYIMAKESINCKQKYTGCRRLILTSSKFYF